ncbi:SGNH/GDSL hydrolase family protein [Mariniflexile ostreae]|uniref:SGNH/GDSL hydrolase family protein n=1 Tax=Mariniflexile ostreae TaxID=1520892 RepID=A0ABV5FCX6_9FLAO
MKRKTFVKLIGTGVLGVGLHPWAYAFQKTKGTNHMVCKNAWDALCGNIAAVYKTDAFHYIEPVVGKPHVLIYGDSISIMYSSTVRECLKSKANVIRLFKNGGASQDFIAHMDKMQEAMFQPTLEAGWDFKWDIIHFNIGLHDLKYLKGKNLNKSGKQVASISDYKTNLHNICKYLKTTWPDAKLIFATTTPVPEHAKGRFVGDSIKFNAAALDVLSKYPDIAINDLYAFTKPNVEHWAQGPGDVHYNALGSSEQGKKVAQAISQHL